MVNNRVLRPRKITLVVALVVLSVLGLIYVYFLSHVESQRSDMIKRGDQQMIMLNNAIRVALKTVDGLKTVVENNLTLSETLKSGYAQYLGPVDGRDGYGLVKLAPPDSADERLNLTGLGGYEKGTMPQGELEVALSLTSVFRWVRSVYPQTPWVYYLSAQRFMSVYPYIPFDEFFMDDAFYEMDLYASGTPANNPQHEPYITKIYEDEAGSGLMVTVGAPVYHAGEFKGIVGFDLTLQDISSSLQRYAASGDNYYLVNEKSEIIAAAGEGIPQGLLSSKKSLDALKPGLMEETARRPETGNMIAYDMASYHISRLGEVPWILITEQGDWQIKRQAALDVVPLVAFLTILLGGVLIVVRKNQHSERIKTEHSFRRFRRLLDFSNDMIVVLEPNNGVIVDANQTMCRFVNMSIDEIKLTSASTLFGSFALFEQWNSDIEQIRREGRLIRELTGRRHGGSALNVELNAYYVEDNDESYIVIILRDIEARRQAEMELRHHRDHLQELVDEKVEKLTEANKAVQEAGQMLQLVLDSIPVRVFWKDSNLVYLGCNKLFAMDSGYEESSDLVGLTDYDMGWLEQADLYQADDRDVMQKGEAKLGYEEPQTTPDGNTIWLQTSKIPLRDIDGNVVGILGTYEDITTRKQAEEQLKLSKMMAQRANEAKSTFLANVSHELRTPMHAILSFSAMGVEKTESAPREKLHRYFSNIHDSGSRLLALVNDLLDLSKLEAGRMLFEKQDNDLRRVAETACNELEEMLDEKNLTVSIEDTAIDTDACFDKDRILQVMYNLLSNAIKFSPEGRHIGISFGATELPAGRRESDSRMLSAVSVSIADQGCGIHPDEMETIFDKFVQSRKLLGSAGGTGLGLAICKEIIDGHTGRIDAENNQDGGATFVFTIPRRSINEKRS
ncbi:MAG: PAS domain S-box protein [Gammaproteobacteria bacterium]|nr:PAS domain S-box protein [Gammaproteobacteria bacterium]MCB1862124.1 PAS domain S-box protein [Gammaproteobacteria bacterium]